MKEKADFMLNTYELYQEFVKKLEQETKAKELIWHTVFQITHTYDTDYFDYILFSNEYHQVDEGNSFGILDHKGISIFLLNETFVSGKDGSVSVEKNLYVVEGLKGKSYQIPMDEIDFLDLESQIKKYIRQKEGHVKTVKIEKNNLQSLIKNYLKK